MADRITDKHLDSLCECINKATKSPLTYMSYDSAGKRTINVGHFHVNSAYGGVQFVRTVTDGGGITVVLPTGYVTKRALYDSMVAYLRGIEFKG